MLNTCSIQPATYVHWVDQPLGIYSLKLTKLNCRSGKEWDFNIAGAFYRSHNATEGIASGAYIFRPDGLFEEERVVNTITVDGPVVTEIRTVSPISASLSSILYLHRLEQAGLLCFIFTLLQYLKCIPLWRCHTSLCLVRLSLSWEIDGLMSWHFRLRSLSLLASQDYSFNSELQKEQLGNWCLHLVHYTVVTIPFFILKRFSIVDWLGA